MSEAIFTKNLIIKKEERRDNRNKREKERRKQEKKKKQEKICKELRHGKNFSDFIKLQVFNLQIILRAMKKIGAVIEEGVVKKRRAIGKSVTQTISGLFGERIS